MSKKLKVTILKNGETFLSGEFEVADDDYAIVRDLLAEMKLDRIQANSLLAGYIHARDMGHVTEELGKLAMAATVFVLEQGETEIQVPLNS